MTHPPIQIESPDEDGIMHVTANGVPLGEIVKSTPRAWDIAEHRPDVTTFYEAINIDGEFLDPLFTTAPAAAAALARLTAASPGDYSSDEHRS